MLREFAFSPDVFFQAAFGVRDSHGNFVIAEDHGHLALASLWKGIERFGVIRDLGGGSWGKVLDARRDDLHARSRELLKKLRLEGRIVPAAKYASSSLENEKGWLVEALASHAAEPALTQFFGTDEFCVSVKAAEYQQLPKGISKIPFCTPFTGGGCSVKVDRNLDAYLNVLQPLIKYSRSLMFIDPYLDLGAPNYRHFLDLLRCAAAINPGVHVELHRQIKPGYGESLRPASEWKRSFAEVLAADPAVSSLNVKVFVWDEFHDRYLISNLMGLSVPHGFDTTSKNEATRWSMLSHDDTCDVRDEFTEGDSQFRRKLQR